MRIHKTKDDSESEICQIWGGISYTAESDFEDITTDDSVDVSLRLVSKRFNKIAELIKTQRIDILELYLNKVSGLYSEWSPSVRTGSIKVLAAQEEQVIVKKDGFEIDPPRLGDVSEFNLSLTQRHKLNLKQNLKSINVNKIFDDFEDAVERPMHEGEPQESQRDKDFLMLSQLSRNEIALNKLRLPIWLIFIVLCIYVFTR